jgi:HEAT repeat protein
MNRVCPKNLRIVLAACIVVALAGCSSRETKEALQKATTLQEQKQYQDANSVLLDALRAREAKIRAASSSVNDRATADALTKKVQADSEILKMERAQIGLYLAMERADLASAIYADIQIGNPGDSVVYTALKSEDPVIRTGAVRVLGLAGKPEAIDALTAATRDSNQDVRRAAVAALGTIKDGRTVQPLIDALKDSYWFVRSDAADALGREKDPRAIQPLLATVPDADSNVESSAENALIMLAMVPGAKADAFAGHLNDSNPKVVTISAVCLALLKDARAVPVLLKLAVSTDAQTRLHAVKALGESGDPSVIPTLRQTLKDPEINVRGWSIIGLGKLNDQASVADLNAIAANDKESANIRAAATAAVKHLTGTAAVSPAQSQ